MEPLQLNALNSALTVNAAIAGAIGGAAIAGMGMAWRAAAGRGLWTLPNSIGGILLGVEAAASNQFGLTTVTGVALHMVLSAIYGIATLVLAPMLGTSYVATGVLVGLIVWVVNHYGVGAVHAPSHRHAGLNPLWLAAFLHIAYGAITGLVIAQLDASL